MKKVMLLASAMLLAGSAMAQTALVKDALKAIKPNSKPVELKAVLESLKPAFTDEASKDDPATWFAAGKAAFGLYDALEVEKTLNKEVDAKEMQQALLDGDMYMKKALSIKEVIERDKNGQPKIDKKTGEPKKIGNKYVKDIQSVIDGHIGSFANAGNAALQSSDWEAVKTFFGVYGDALDGNTAIPDSSKAEIRFFEGYGAYNCKAYQEGYEALTKAIALGYTANQVKDFQAACVGGVVEAYCNEKNYAGAKAMVEKAIATEPQNGNYQNIMGWIIDTETEGKGADQSLAYYQKAIELDPTIDQAQFQIGVYHYNKAVQIMDENKTLDQDKLIPLIKPELMASVPYFEKALAIGKNYATYAKSYLSRIYYALEGAESENYKKYAE